MELFIAPLRVREKLPSWGELLLGEQDIYQQELDCPFPSEQSSDWEYPKLWLTRVSKEEQWEDYVLQQQILSQLEDEDIEARIDEYDRSYERSE